MNVDKSNNLRSETTPFEHARRLVTDYAVLASGNASALYGAISGVSGAAQNTRIDVMTVVVALAILFPILVADLQCSEFTVWDDNKLVVLSFLGTLASISSWSVGKRARLA